MTRMATLAKPGIGGPPARRRWRLDMHVHTFRSPDCNSSYEKLIARARTLDIDCLAITDHDRMRGALEMQTLGELPIIVGEEIKTREGEIIGLFLKEWIPPRLTPEETVRLIREQGGIVYIPHPFDRLRRSPLRPEALDRIADLVDAIEVINSRNHFREDNWRAEEFAARHGLLRGAGSDAHSLYELGHALVELDPFDDRDSFLRSLEGATVSGVPSLPIVHVVSSWHKFRKGRLAKLLRRPVDVPGPGS